MEDPLACWSYVIEISEHLFVAVENQGTLLQFNKQLIDNNLLQKLMAQNYNAALKKHLAWEQETQERERQEMV